MVVWAYISYMYSYVCKVRHQGKQLRNRAFRSADPAQAVNSGQSGPNCQSGQKCQSGRKRRSTLHFNGQNGHFHLNCQLQGWTGPPPPRPPARPLLSLFVCLSLCERLTSLSVSASPLSPTTATSFAPYNGPSDQRCQGGQNCQSGQKRRNPVRLNGQSGQRRRSTL
jgi:hypothetical protein